MGTESTTPTLDGIVDAIQASGEFSLDGYDNSVLILAVRETYHEFSRIMQELSGVYTTFGLLMGELDERINPPVEAETD